MSEAAVSAPASSAASASKRAAGSSFYSALRILPSAQREAMFEIYSFCRLVDDIADSDAPRAERMAQLEQWRADIAALYEGKVAPRVARLAKAVADFGLSQADFLAVIDGMEMDAAADVRAPSLATLDLYCDRVASAVGRLSVRVFGIEREQGDALAHHLGRALQLTNILRDLDRDAAIGRLYLPGEYLREAGIESTDPNAVLGSANLARVCERLAAKAQSHFAEAGKIMLGLPRPSVRAPRIMAEVYRNKLEKLMSRGWTAPRADVSTGYWRLAWTLLRYAIV